MSNKYYDASDAAHRMEMKKLAPKDFEAWFNFNAIPGQDHGVLSPKIREIVAVAVAHATGCPYCIESHVTKAKAAGVTKTEVAEAVLISAALCAGAAAAHGGLAMKFYGDEE